MLSATVLLLVLLVAVLAVVSGIIVVVVRSGRKPRSTVAPGWYPDPSDGRLLRYHDGRDWSPATQPRP
ncbi:DUF2510 domain-containing protein [Nocardia sp. NPDC050793]|uniref:DUF2510 domain-containing protein n=1 Tax=Nocardia sp. NPDC050793 TaxID=3155159 RepID=UPI0033FDDE3C